MSPMRAAVTRTAWTLAASLSVLVMGCGPSAETRQRMADLEQAAAEKDNLLAEIADLGRFISNVNAELADVSLEESGLQVMAESPMQAARDSVLVKIRYLNDRVADGERRLAESRRRIRYLSLQADSMQTLLAETIRSYERTLESQRVTIEALTERVSVLAFENVRLAATVDTLASELDTLKAETSTVYYAVGTKRELLDRGIVEEEGGARFLFLFGKRGKVLVPAREIDPAEFTPLNKDETWVINLGDTTAQYEIVSRHSTEFVSSELVEDRKITGTFLQILSPNQFWQNSKFLIIVRKS